MYEKQTNNITIFVVLIYIIIGIILLTGISFSTTNNKILQVFPAAALPELNSMALSSSSMNSTLNSNVSKSNITDVSTLAEILKNATPAEVVSLNLTQYSPAIYLKALDSLSPKDLAVVLGKVSSAYGKLALTNITSFDLAHLLNKLPPNELAIAFTYPISNISSYNNEAVIEKLDRTDLAHLLNKLPPNELAIALNRLGSKDFSRSLLSISPHNLTRIINELSPTSVAEKFHGYKAIVDALSYHETIDLLSKLPFKALPIELSQFDQDTVKDVLNKIPIVKQGIVLNNLSAIYRHDILIPTPAPRVEVVSSASELLKSVSFPYGSPVIDFSAMLHIILSNSSIEEIKQIPFNEYPIYVLSKALSDLPQDKQKAALEKFPDYERKDIILHINR